MGTHSSSPSLPPPLIIELLKTEALRGSPETASRLIRPTQVPTASSYRDTVIDALMQLWDSGDMRTPKQVVLRIFKALTGERWFPCPDCGGIVGPDTGFMCYRKSDCIGVLCPFCGARCFNDKCIHLVGTLGDNDGTDRLLLHVRWPRVDFPDPTALDGDNVYDMLERLPQRERRWMRDVIANFGFETYNIIPALSSAHSTKGPSAILQAWCLRELIDTVPLRHVDHDPPGGGFATGIAPYFFARTSRERRHASAVINRALRRLARCLKEMLAPSDVPPRADDNIAS